MHQLLLTASSYDNVSILQYIIFGLIPIDVVKVTVISYRLSAINLKRQSVRRFPL